MVPKMKEFVDLCNWRPGYSTGKLIALCLLGWVIVNSSALIFSLVMPPYGAFPDFRYYLMAIFSLLSGITWANDWFYYWPCIPLLAPLFIVSQYAYPLFASKPLPYTERCLVEEGSKSNLWADRGWTNVNIYPVKPDDYSTEELVATFNPHRKG